MNFFKHDTLDETDPAYESFKEVLAVMSFYRIGKSSVKFLEGVKKHKLTIAAKCQLHNKQVDSIVHFSMVAYVFMYLKGKMQVTSKFAEYLQERQYSTNDQSRFFELFPLLSDIVHFVGKANKGDQLPLERKTVKDKLVWHWTDPIYGTYKRLMQYIVQYNINTTRPAGYRQHTFFFDDLTEKTINDYAEQKMFCDAKDKRNTPLEDIRESRSHNVDLRFQEYVPGSGGDDNQSHLNIGFSRTWHPNLG
jgi:hypothetical protein